MEYNLQIKESEMKNLSVQSGISHVSWRVNIAR